MNKNNFPWIALVFGLVLLGGLFASGAIPPSGSHKLPLLMQLFMSEFGALLCAAGAYAGGSNWLANRQNISAMLAALICAVLAVALGASGIMIWQHSVAS